ncbi:MAG: hypothetical protein DRP42_05335 [Tenericutes bacterium]|nr:MAG: hypothetical protein DRP42_05335 [Mycoplasmatota bacterium]
MSKPNCYDCKHRRDVPGDAHSGCANLDAKVEGAKHGKQMGWFMWPINFDPTWLLECDGFAPEFSDA